MSKKSSYKIPMTERIGQPIITRDKQGNAILNCPFCEPTHPLRPENNAQCGTMLQVRAVQITYKAKYDKRFVCVKCGKGGGEMVKFQNGFVHTHNCSPGVVTLENPPAFSKLAERIHAMPPMMKKSLEAIFGETIPVLEVMPDGTKTGVTLGYFFKRGRNAKRKTTSAN
jgi:hypothetical protein